LMSSSRDSVISIDSFLARPSSSRIRSATPFFVKAIGSAPTIFFGLAKLDAFNFAKIPYFVNGLVCLTATTQSVMVVNSIISTSCRKSISIGIDM
jgi:hypothetical protein